MSKSNVNILQYKQNIWKGSYKYSIEQGIFTKWWRCLEDLDKTTKIRIKWDLQIEIIYFDSIIFGYMN